MHPILAMHQQKPGKCTTSTFPSKIEQFQKSSITVHSNSIMDLAVFIFTKILKL
jgi:hypothetical protein